MYKRLNDKVIETEVDGKTVTRTLGYIKRDSDKAVIPMNEANPDYLKYLEDVKAGAEVTDYDYEAEKARQVAAGIETKSESDREELIQKRIRKIAVNELVTEGKIEAEAVKIETN